MDALLAAPQRNRRYASGDEREDLLQAFEMIQDEPERISAARRQLAALLHGSPKSQYGAQKQCA
ncbi:MAG: tetratricopeptide repeat protein [Steroidobacteraceae bacterium]